MKYTPEITQTITNWYLNEQKSAAEIASSLKVPERSVIAKLSALGIYRKKTYLNKQGVPPIKKAEYISRIATLLDLDSDLLECMEKLTKTLLRLICERLESKYK